MMNNKPSNTWKRNYKMLPLSGKVRIKKIRRFTSILNLKRQDRSIKIYLNQFMFCHITTEIIYFLFLKEAWPFFLALQKKKGKISLTVT